jgi:glycosyltransferase involved in cell wall biosynthesis
MFMKLSIIIPAYNEEKLLPGCLARVYAAIRANASSQWACEVIVVDNNSRDRTAELARAAGATVVFEPINQISRARNEGARIATGDWFLFIDADSYLHPTTLRELLRCIRRGRDAGGGCLVGVDEVPAVVTVLLTIWDFLSRTLRWAAGSFVFCRADAFREIGGFSNELFATEEIRFSQDLGKWARAHRLGFALLRGPRHISSGRKFHLYSPGEMLRLALRACLPGQRALLDRSRLDYFYDGRR